MIKIKSEAIEKDDEEAFDEATLLINVDSWTALATDDFESDWGNYTDGGEDASRSTDATYAHGGSATIDIQRKGSDASFCLTNGIDVDTAGLLFGFGESGGG